MPNGRQDLTHKTQWEKAARGIDGRSYPFGRWDASRCNTWEDEIGTTTPYSAYEGRGESPYRCLDMSGNVWEWMENPENSENSECGDEEYKILSGGSCFYCRKNTRSARRLKHSPATQCDEDGFRCAMTT